jgi:hypothetical protein
VRHAVAPAALGFFAALSALAGCGNGSHGGGDMLVVPPDMAVASECPNDLPAACPAPAPSWDGGVQAIIEARCVVCHKSGGLAFDKPFTTYADVYGYRSAMLDQVYSCYMPPPDAGQLDPSERRELLGWFVCGAPNN